MSRPAELLSARFETDHLAGDIARRAAEESAKDAGALPLLSYLLDDMWKQMVERGDGVLRLPAQSIELGRVLVQRADAFLASHPNSEETLRRIFTLKLATVREDGEPTRRRAFAFGILGRGMAACQRPRRPPQSALGHRYSGGRRDLCRGRARGDLPALGQAARMDRRRARVFGLAQRARSRATRLAGHAGQYRRTTRC